MSRDTVVGATHALRRLADEDTAWRLLRADNAPVILAALAEHLSGDQRRLPADELSEILDSELEALRAHGFDLPLSGRGYCDQWRRSGYLVRRPAEAARGETLELSPAAVRALRMVQQLSAPRSAVTESRLTSLSDQLRRLASETDPDASRRLAELHAERARLDEQIERVSAGDFEVLAPERALERVRDILGQAEEVPADFARVRARFEELNRRLRARILESDDNQRTVLDEIFRGVDLISDSEEGRSFAGFSALVLDPELGSAFEGDVARVLERDFAGSLSAGERRFLRRLLTRLKDRSGEIHEVITVFARGLRRYVQSQDYRRDRVMRGVLNDAATDALVAARVVKPYTRTRVELALSSVAVGSVGVIRLHDPSEFDATAPIVEHDEAEADLAALRALARETEIDFAELTADVNDLLQRRDTATVAEVLAEHPATQGVASVIGLMALAAEQGTIGDGLERIDWVGTDGCDRAARIPTHRFTGRVL